jgi:drug/metabolite transporter (DMT)-like permease
LLPRSRCRSPPAASRAGASRTAVVIGTAPLLSAGLAVVFLDEPLRAALVLATVVIVLGGALLVWEPSRPPDFRPVGLVLALVAAGLFAVRDNVVGERDRRRTAQRDPVALGSALRGGLHRPNGGGRAAPGRRLRSRGGGRGVIGVTR